jgi:hypothetical protein
VSFIVVGCSLNRPWYLREYQDAEPRDKATLEYQGHILYVECTGTHFSKPGDITRCGWLRQHVGSHLGEGKESGQLTRLGSQVCYHDGIGGEVTVRRASSREIVMAGCYRQNYARSHFSGGE